MLITKKLMNTDFHSVTKKNNNKKQTWKSMASVNCLVTNILQNIFCVQQKTENCAGLQQVKGE